MAHELVQIFADIVVTMLGIVLVITSRKIVGRVNELLDLRLDDAEEHRLTVALEKAIFFAEEQAHRAVKAGAERLSSTEKMYQAVEFVQSEGFDLNPAEIEPLIATQLGAMRLRGRTPTKE